MRTLRKWTAAVLAAFAFWFAATAAGQAGVFISWGQYDRALWPGASVPYDGEPFSHRYGYYAGPTLSIGGDYNHFLYMDYLDRLDRAEKFGYRIPAPPAFLTQPACRPCAK